MTGLQFRTRQFLFSLSPAKRQAVANRERFYSIPWIRPTDQPDDDFLP